MKLFSTLLICLLLYGTGRAQSDSLKVKDRSRPSYRHMDRHTYLETQVDFQALSNQLSVVQINDLLNDDFLDQAEKNELTNSINASLRYGYFREFSFTYRKPAVNIFDQTRPGQGFRLRNAYIQSALLDQQTLDLIFYGNKPYEEQTLDLGPAGFETWYYTSLDYLFDVRLDTQQVAEISVGVVLGHDHNSYDLRGGSLYTASEGEYLDAELDYSLRDQVRENLTLNGLGLSLGFQTELKVGDNKSLSLNIADAGLIYWNRGRILDTDSSFRFTGATFENILNITDSITDALGEQYRRSFLYEEEGDYLSIMPFYLNAEFRIHRKKVLQDIRIGAEYRYLPGFLPRVYAGIGLLLSRSYLLNIEGSTGGYNPYRLDMGVKTRLGYNWELVANIINLQQLILINEPGGAGVTMRLRYRL